MRVLWLSHASGGTGGAEMCLAEGVDALAERGHEVHVLLPEEGALRERLEAAASVHVCWHNPWASVTPPPYRNRIAQMVHNASRASAQIARVANATDAQLIVSNTIVIPAGALAARRARRPHIWFLHEFGDADHSLRFHFGGGASRRFMNRYTDLFLVNSHALLSHFARWIPETKLIRVHYAVDVPNDLPSRDNRSGDTLRLVLVGERKLRKGQQDAVAAVGVLARAGIDVELDLIGSGKPDFDGELRELATTLGIAGRVRLIDFQDARFELVTQADAVLMCSRSEALGRVTVEAMKLGKPVIGAAAGATQELIRHGWNGFLYEPGNPADLARWIEQLSQDRLRAQEMGRRGRAWVAETFNRDVYASDLEEAFEAARSTVAAHSNRRKAL